MEQLGPDRRSAPRHLALSLAPVTACWRVIQLTLRRPGARGLIGGLLPLSRCLCPEARERPGSSGSPDGRSRFHHENGFKRFKVMRRPMRGGPGRRGGGGGSTAAPPDATLRPRALRVAALRPEGGVRARAAPCRLTAVQGQLPRGRACMAPSLTFDQLTPLTGRLGAQTLYSWDAGIRPGKERKS